MVLTRVCSPWRSVALSSPRIWTRLHIPLPGDPRMYSSYGTRDDEAVEIRRRVFSKMMQLRCRAVKDWLGRSGSLPLSLSIAFPFGYEPPTDSSGAEDDEVVDPLFHTIRPFASRWRHLDLSMPFYIYQKLETTIPLENLSMLRYFKGNILLHGAHTPTAPHPTPVPLHIIDLPALEGLSITCTQLTMNLRHYPSSWDRLTDICFESPVSDTDFLEILKQCHNLITLDVYIQIPRVRMEGLEPTFKMVLLPHLEVLKLRESGSSSAVISTINAPFVKSLEYRCPRRYDYDEDLDPPLFLIPDSLIWLISNAAASLKSLSIDPATLRPEHVLQCLRLAPHVKDLIFGDMLFFSPPDLEEDTLYEPDFFDLEAFTVHTPEYDSSTPGGMPLQNDILLPNLESLEVNGGYIVADEILRTILLSRIDSAQRGLTSPLRRVQVQFARKKRGDIEPEIVARARDAGIGMKLDLVYQPSGPNIGPLSPSFLSPEVMVHPIEYTRMT